ncbi:MAG: C10 family peptidase [Kiritimatiellae bacterium]|nr:C10 family peptidase [Kiritimatiellia bacterium]
MKRGTKLFSMFATTMGVALSAFGAGVTGDDAKGTVTGWVRLREALGDEIDAEPESVATYPGADGRGEFHVVSLKGGGYVITSGDTEITPILGYSKTGTFDADENSPMWALLTADVAARAAAVEASGGTTASVQQQGVRLAAASGGTTASVQQQEGNADQWSRLMAAGKSGGKRLQAKTSSPPTDLRVASFVRSKWGQSTATSGNGYTHNYYNNYTPNKYPCGCVATAFAQTMRYFEFPKTSVTPKTFTCKVGGTATDLTMQGGTYDWAHMPYVPREVTYDWNNVIGIAKLTSDAGISVCMSYNSGGSSSSSSRVGDSLVSTFGYSNAIMDYSSGCIKGNAFKQNVIPSLDAKLPVVLGIQGRPTGSATADAGHSILTDGYGYYNNQLYIHLNMGWSGSDDAWYTPADSDTDAIINASNYNFTNIHTTVFNIFTNATRYSVIASGRVLDQGAVGLCLPDGRRHGAQGRKQLHGKYRPYVVQQQFLRQRHHDGFGQPAAGRDADERHGGGVRGVRERDAHVFDGRGVHILHARRIDAHRLLHALHRADLNHEDDDREGAGGQKRLRAQRRVHAHVRERRRDRRVLLPPRLLKRHEGVYGGRGIRPDTRPDQ